MNPQSRCRSRRARAAAVISVAAVGLLASACGSSPSSGRSGGASNTGTSALSSSAVAYSGCMRSHGVPAYPDPSSGGQLPKTTPSNESQLGVSRSRFSAAQTACQRLWPYRAPTQAQEAQQLTEDLKFARCLRARGVPVPDPTSGPSGPRFVISISKDGFNPHSPKVLAKARECEHVMPAGWTLPPVTVTP